MNSNKKALWILALTCFLFSSCIRNAFKNPCSWPRRLFNGENIEACYRNFYWGFKPVVKKDKNGNISYAWKLCQAKRNYESLKHELFVVANKNEKGEIVPDPGFPVYVNGGVDGAIDLVTGGTIRYGQAFPISRALVNIGEYDSKNIRLYNSGYEIRDEEGNIYKNEGNDAVMVALRECQDYNYFKAAAAANGCLNTFACLPDRYYNQLDNCTRRGNGDTDFSLIPCPPLKELPALFSPDNQEKQVLINGISTLYQHKENVNGRVIGSDYQVSATSDFIKPPSSNIIPNPRYAYLEVKIGDGYIGNKNSRHKLSISHAGANVADIPLSEKAVTGIRNCKSFEQGYKQYVIQCPLTGVGSYDVKVIDMDNGLGTVAQTSLSVSGLDQITTAKPYSSDTRNLNLVTISLPQSPRNAPTIPDLGYCGLGGANISTLESALEDAYSLNMKESYTSANTKVKKGIDINHTPCGLDINLYKHFNDNWDLKLRLDDIQQVYTDLRFPLDPNNSKVVTDVYKIAMAYIGKDLYKKHSSGCRDGGYTNLENQTTAVLVGGVQLANTLYQVISKGDGGGANDDAKKNYDLKLIETVGAPVLVLSNNTNSRFLKGTTLPNYIKNAPDFLENDNLQYSNSIFIFGKYLMNEKFGDFEFFPAIDLPSMATIILGHEICHSWGDSYVMGSSGNAVQDHSLFCTGYNSSVCNFRLESLHPGIWANFRANGMVLCEGHKHILFNQLLRKYYLR